MPSSAPPLHRPRDTYIVIFLISYAFTTLFIDNIALYPAHLVPGPLMNLHEYYKATFNDQLAIARPYWFHFFALNEALYQFPVTVWAAWALWNRNPKAPAHLLVWGVITGGTTWTCMWEFWYNDFGGIMTWEQRQALIGMFGIYAVIFSVIGLDMFQRVQKTLVAAAKISAQEKKLN